MALNIGENFKQRWLATPELVRQSYCDELTLIANLLEPDTQIIRWQQQEAIFKQRQRQIIEHAYQQRKAEILAEQARIVEERRQKRQAELEAKLAAKRAAEQAQLHAAQQQEQLKQQQQTAFLQQLAQELAAEHMQQAQQHIARFDVSQAKQFDLSAENSNNSVDKYSDFPQAEDLKVRLELEAEYYIENTLQQLRTKLQAAAQEEIALLLAQQQ